MLHTVYRALFYQASATKSAIHRRLCIPSMELAIMNILLPSRVMATVVVEVRIAICGLIVVASSDILFIMR